jgi:hypothetical protein
LLSVLSAWLSAWLSALLSALLSVLSVEYIRILLICS